MENIERNALEAEFVKTLVAAVNEVRSLTRIGVSEILDQIRTNGGLKVAKQSLRPPSSESAPLFEHLVRYPFLSAAKRVGRPDLSLEFLALQPNWSPLFTAEELEVARKRLRKFDVNPDRLEDYLPPIPRIVTELASSEPILSLTDSAWSGADPSDREMSPCEVTAQLAAEVGAIRDAVAVPAVRRHLRECESCRRDHQKLSQAYRRTDEQAFRLWIELVQQFEQSLRLNYEDHKHVGREPWEADTAEDDSSEYDDEYEYLAELDFDHRIRPLLAWRALRLGIHLGRFMQRITHSFAPDRSQWLRWRGSEMNCEASAAVNSLSDQQFLFTVMATYLPLLRHWPEEEENLLWLPTENAPGNESASNLSSVKPLLRAEDAPFDDWEEILGKPPQDLEPMNLLYVAYQAARFDVASLQPSTHVIPAQAPDQAAVLLEILRNQKEQLNLSRQILDQQGILISETNRIVAHMDSTDRHSAEQELISTLGEVYGRLDPYARSLLLAAVQIEKVPGIAAPSTVVAAIATAFEIQLRSAVLVRLLGFLRDKGTPTLMPQQQAAGSCHRSRPVYAKWMKIDQFDLGGMEQLLNHQDPVIEEFFGHDRHQRTEITEKIAAVRPHRNEASHRATINEPTALSLADQWLGRSKRGDSIFAVLFPLKI